MALVTTAGKDLASVEADAAAAQSTASAAIPLAQKAAASGVASLDGSTLVVQDPTNAVSTATASKIVKRDTNGDVIVPATPSSANAAVSNSYVGTLLTHVKGSSTYAGASPVYAEWHALLPAVGDYGYLRKGATDSVFHAFRRSIAAGTLADFGIVEMS